MKPGGKGKKPPVKPLAESSKPMQSASTPTFNAPKIGGIGNTPTNATKNYKKGK
jgi:hypothetical protein